MTKPACSIVIPAHNEEEIIGATIESIRTTLRESGRDWQIVVVDDGSSDATFEKAKSALGGQGLILRLSVCRGKAGAIVEGVQACSTEFLLFTDADLSVPPVFFEKAAENLQHADVVIASRHLPGSKLLRRQPWLRETCGEIFRVLVQRLFLPDISDFTCGLKAFRTIHAREMFRNLNCLDWTFDVELLLRAREANLKISELPVTWDNRLDSRVRLFSAIAGSLRSLWKLHRAYGAPTARPS